MLPHRLLVSNPLLVQGSWFRVRGSRRRVRCPMSDVAKGEERVPSEAGDIWLALAGVPPRQQPLQVPSDIGGSGGARGVASPISLGAEGERGGPRAVTRRRGSPREPQSEGPRVLLQQNQQP